tara:strand:+ start:379 stop:939 length:561 start_codon:yes stop_codon:yes gene_type:complete
MKKIIVEILNINYNIYNNKIKIIFSEKLEDFNNLYNFIFTLKNPIYKDIIETKFINRKKFIIKNNEIKIETSEISLYELKPPILKNYNNLLDKYTYNFENNIEFLCKSKIKNNILIPNFSDYILEKNINKIKNKIINWLLLCNKINLFFILNIKKKVSLYLIPFMYKIIIPVSKINNNIYYNYLHK